MTAFRERVFAARTISNCSTLAVEKDDDEVEEEEGSEADKEVDERAE